VGGWLLRRTLDELRQLVDVPGSDMSLAGPRHTLSDEAAVDGDYARRKLAVRPGITGLSQVNGWSGLSWNESVRLDHQSPERPLPSRECVTERSHHFLPGPDGAALDPRSLIAPSHHVRPGILAMKDLRGVCARAVTFRAVLCHPLC
jgi:hypothetical protein